MLPWQHSAPAVPGLIVVFHLQQEKDLFSSQRFHVNILQECVCVISGVGSGLWWLYVANNCRNISNGCFFFQNDKLFSAILCLFVFECVLMCYLCFLFLRRNRFGETRKEGKGHRKKQICEQR